MTPKPIGVARVEGERGRYYVASTRGPVLVDICALGGNGQCGCEDFAFRQRPALDSGQPGWHRCKHIERAREWELDEAIRIHNLANPQEET